MKHREPTAWIPVARNVKRFACLSSIDELICSHHRTIGGMLNCRKSKHCGAVLKNGEVISLSVKHLSASNGEKAILPYANTEKDYDAVMRSDSTN